MSCKFYVLGYSGSELSPTYTSMLSSVLETYGIESDTYVNWIIGAGESTSAILESQKSDIYQDIVDRDPQVIIALGSAVSEFLIGDKYISLSRQAGKILSTRIDDKAFPVVPTYSINYLIPNEEDPSKATVKGEFVKHILQAVKLVSGEISDISTKELVTALSYSELVDYIDKHIKDDSLVAYDIETNAQPVHSEWFKTIGFSLSSSKDSGVYVVREALEYKLSQEEWDSITAKLLEILKSHRIVVHNSMYEVPAGVNEYDYRLENFDDTLVMARLLLGGKVGAGLKEQCQANLGYPEWEADLTTYREAMDDLRKLFKPTDKGAERQEFLDLVEYDGDILKLMNKYNSELEEYTHSLADKFQAGSISDSEYTAELEKVPKRRDSRLVKDVSDIYQLIQDYYHTGEPTVDTIMNLIGKELIYLIESSEYGFLPYSSVPLKLLSRYGAIDAVGTRELYDVLSKRLTDESTEDVDLWKGYNIMKSQFEVGTSMEMNGLFWNDDVANHEQEWFNSQACKAMVSMLQSGFLDEYIYNNCRTPWIDFLMTNSKEELVEQLGFNYVLTDLGIKKFVDGEVKGREIRKYNIANLVPESYWESIKPQLLTFNKIRIMDPELFKNFNDFKDIYNPASPGQHNTLNPILVTEDIKLASILQSFYLIIDDLNRTIDEFPMPDKGVLQTLIDFNTYNHEVHDWNEEHPDEKKASVSKGEIFNKFKEMLTQTTFKSKELNRLIVEGLKYQLESGDEPSLINLYHLYCLIGIDIEDESTWSPQFRFLYDFRMYKKCIKMINSYITGDRVGRGSVTIVNNKDLDSQLARRVGWYDANHPKRDDQSYIMQPKYGVCSANTLRWTSGQHTIPSTSSIKNIYTSRYPGGVIFAPDYCLTGDTLIRLANGSDVPIKDLVNQDEWYVYSWDSDNKRVVVGRGHDCREVRKVDKLLELVLDNGESVKCTPEHKFYDCDKEAYVEAQYLQVGSELFPLTEPVNIRIAAINELEVKSEPVYCFTVDDYHNFWLSCGINSSNSQMEIRAIAAISGCQTLVQAFIDGMDIHRFNACFTGNTRVWLADGTRPTFEELCDRYTNPDEEFSVYSMSDNNTITIGKAKYPRKTQVAEQILEITFSNGSKVKCTPNHLWRLTNGKYVEACTLTTSDQVATYCEKGISPVIIDIKLIEESIDVYDLTVDEYHNFAVDTSIGDSKSAVFVHNSKIWRKPPEEVTSVERRYAKMSCVVGSTKVKLLDGTIKTVEELYNSGLREVDTYSFDTSSNHIKMSKSNDIQLTKRVNETVVVTFDNGYQLECTPDHPLLTLSGEYVYAQDSLNELIRAMDDSYSSNVEVIKVETKKHEESIPVYDLSIPKYHNYPVYLGDNTSIFVHNSFSILYGDTPEGFAQKFLAGDESLGRQIFHDFYEAYPEIKEWTEARHTEMMRTGKVSLAKTGMFLNVSPDEFYGDEMKAKRASGNYPIQSLSEGVEVYGLDGKYHKIGELARNKEDLFTLACDVDGKVVPVRGINAQCTGETKTWYKLTLDNGKSIKVTPDHRMMLRDGTFKRADELVEGQSLMPCYLSISNLDGTDYSCVKDNKTGQVKPIHKLVQQYMCPKPNKVDTDKLNWNVHHIDMDKSNNLPSNLVEIPTNLHMHYHRVLQEIIHDQNNMSDKLKSLESDFYEDIKSYYTSEDCYNIMNSIKKFHESILNKTVDLSYLRTNSLSYKNKVRSTQYPEWDHNQREAASQEVYRRLAEHGSVLGNYSHEELSQIHKTKVWGKHRDTIMESLKKGHNTPEARANHRDAVARMYSTNQGWYNNQIARIVKEMYELSLPYSTPDEYEESLKSLVKVNPKNRRHSWTILNRMTWSEFLSLAKGTVTHYNHKLVKIEVIHLDKPEPKYDLHVPYYENFALACGVFTHNSQASNMAGYILSQADKYLRSNHMRTKPVLFIHDSLEFDVHPMEMLKAAQHIIHMMNEIPYNEFGIPAKVDLELGVSLGQGVDASEIEINEDSTKGSMVIEGKLSNFELLIDKWKSIYSKVEVEYLEDPEQIYVPRGDLFVPKLTLSRSFGTYEKLIKAKVNIEY